jgi:hypothetical protein
MATHLAGFRFGNEAAPSEWVAAMLDLMDEEIAKTAHLAVDALPGGMRAE